MVELDESRSVAGRAVEFSILGARVMGRFTEQQREQLIEGLKVIRDAQKQKKDVDGRDDVLAVQIIKGKGFTNMIFDAYGPNESVYTIDDKSFGIFVDRLTAIDAVEMGHDMFVFNRYDRCPEMAEDGEE